MKRFMALYIGSASPEEKQMKEPDPAAQEKGMAAWGKWMTDHASSIVDFGGPLGKTIRVSPAGMEAAVNKLAAYIIVQAASHEDAARMFEGHPHFAVFPGDSVEILECLPVPGASDLS